jgi:hypothetical protein
MTMLVGGALARCPDLQSRSINSGTNREDDMNATQTHQYGSSLEPWLQGGGEECRPLIAEAEREIGAFVSAVREIFGSAAAARAAEYWIEFAETVSPAEGEGRPNWRKLTIMASCRLAADSIFGGESAEG